jgi:hypothetical protein
MNVTRKEKPVPPSQEAPLLSGLGSRRVLFLIGFLGIGALLAGSVALFVMRGEMPYVSIVTATGDTYFGRLSVWPQFKLTDVFVLQRFADAQGQVQLNVAPLTDAFWQPVDEFVINRENVIGWSRIRPDSQLLTHMRERRQAQPAAFQAAPSEFAGPSVPPPGVPLSDQ